MTALSAADREQVQAELEALKEKHRNLLPLNNWSVLHKQRREEALARSRAEIARLERLLVQ